MASMGEKPHFCIVMEFCDNTLQDRIDAHGEDFFNNDIVFNWCGQLLCGLEFLHEGVGKNKQIILHRDIKPEVIFSSLFHI